MALQRSNGTQVDDALINAQLFRCDWHDQARL